MATLFFPFTNQATGSPEFPWWAIFADDEEEQHRPRQSCSSSARRHPCWAQRKPTACQGKTRQNAQQQAAASPEEFLTRIASVFLPGLLEAVAAANAGTPKAEASTSASAKEAPKNCDEFLSTAAAFASTYFPELYDAVTEAIKKDEAKPTKSKNNAFEVKLKVSDFTPQELNVKTVENTIVVEGKHEEKQDDQGFVSRSFTRRFVIPDEVKPDAVECKLTTDGFLILSAPTIVEPPVVNERSVPITLSALPAEAIVPAPAAAAAVPDEVSADKVETVPGQATAENASEESVDKLAVDESDEEIVIVPRVSSE